MEMQPVYQAVTALSMHQLLATPVGIFISLQCFIISQVPIKCTVP